MRALFNFLLGHKTSADQSRETEVLEFLRKMGKAYGSQGGKTAAKNMTSAERSARAKKASLAAARKRTAKRLAREGARSEKINRSAS